jgi:hypothetical protein
VNPLCRLAEREHINCRRCVQRAVLDPRHLERFQAVCRGN